MSSRVLAMGALTLALSVPAFAQVGSNGVYGGVGTVTLGPIDTNILGGNNGDLGVQYFPPTGTFFVSRRGAGALTTVPHSLIEIDQTGALLNAWSQGPGLSGGAWGHRDGGTDAYASPVSGMNTFWGDELGIHCYDHSGGAPVYITGAHTVAANNGPQTVTFPFNAANAFVGGNSRALEYDPAGDGGNGSFWVCNFGSALVEISLAGVVLKNYPAGTNPVPQWSAYGLAMNVRTNRLWVNSSPAGSATVIPQIAELDPNTGIFTGRRFNVAGTLTTGAFIFGAQGGLCYVEGRVGPAHQPAGAPPFSELCALNQATPDNIVCHRLDLVMPGPNYDSAQEARLEASVGGGAFSTAAQTYTPGALVQFQYNQDPLAVPGIALCIANIAIPGFAPAPLGDTFNVAEFVALNNLSTPGAGISGVGAFTIGDGFGLGGILAPDVLFVPGATQPVAPTPAISLPSLGGPGTQVTLQTVYFDPLAGLLIATNRITLTEL